MTDLRPLSEGELVWAPIAFQRDGEVITKDRPALVLRVLSEKVVVAWGTSTAREQTRVEVEPTHRRGRAWGLSSTTYFYERNLAALSPDTLRRLGPSGGRMADPLLVVAIRELALKRLIELSPEGDGST